MTTAIITSDWHGDAYTAGMNRYDDIDAAVQSIVDVALKERADLFCFLGDLCDPDNVRSHRVSALACRTGQQLSAGGVANIWLTGNHDVIEDGNRTHTLSALKALNPKWATVIDEPAYGCIPNAGMAYVVALPFTARTHPYDADAFVRAAKADYDQHGKGRLVIVMGHLMLPGVEEGSESGSMSRGRDFDFPFKAVAECFPKALVVNGHYHKRQTWTTPHGFDIHIPGSLERLRFDEEHHEPGYLKVSW